jgi:hypothetical protein
MLSHVSKAQLNNFRWSSDTGITGTKKPGNIRAWSRVNGARPAATEAHRSMTAIASTSIR